MGCDSRFVRQLTVLGDGVTILFGHDVPPDRFELQVLRGYFHDLVYNFGLISLIPFIYLIVNTGVLFFKNKKKNPAETALFLMVVYLVVVVGFSESMLKQPYPGIITFFLWGILLSIPFSVGKLPRK